MNRKYQEKPVGYVCQVLCRRNYPKSSSVWISSPVGAARTQPRGGAGAQPRGGAGAQPRGGGKNTAVGEVSA